MWNHVHKSIYIPDNDVVCFKSMLQSKLNYSTYQNVKTYALDKYR